MKVIKSKSIRCAGNVARMGEMRNTYFILFGKSEGKRLFGELDIDDRIILEYVLRKCVRRM